MRQFKCPECYHTGELADFEKIHINGDTCVLCPECKAKYNVSELIKLVEDEMYYGGYDNKEDEQKKLVKQVEKMQQQISNTSGHVGGLSDHPLKHRNGGDKMDTGIISKIRESLTDNRDCDLAINILKEIGKFVEDGGEVKCSMRVVFSLLGTDFVELAYSSDREIMLRASGFNEDVTNMLRIVYESPFEKSSIRIERLGRIE